jgi:hypothetical protein
MYKVQWMDVVSTREDFDWSGGIFHHPIRTSSSWVTSIPPGLNPFQMAHNIYPTKYHLYSVSTIFIHTCAIPFGFHNSPQSTFVDEHKKSIQFAGGRWRRGRAHHIGP